MADPPNKKVFSIFQPKSKPVPSTSTAETSPPNPSNSTSKASTSSSTSPEATVPSQNPSKPRRLAPAALKDSDCITLGSSDDEDDGSSSTVKSSSRGIKTSSSNIQKNGKGKGKGKARAIVVDSEEDDDEDLVVIKGLTPKKGMKDRDGKKRKAKGENGKKGKKTMESIDLTISPPRKSTGSSFKPSSSTSFAPLSDVYRHERERRKVNEGIEPRWPTAEEHGYLMSSPSTSRVVETSGAERYPRGLSEGEKGKGREVEDEEEGFLERYMKSIEQDSSTPRFSPSSTLPSSYRDHPIASTSTLLPDFPSHPLLDRLATPLTSAQPNQPKIDQAVQSELWTTKYGPKKAEEVLGNMSGGSALILKEWLTVQKVEGGGNEGDYSSLPYCP